MYNELAQFYKERVFACSLCRQRLMNPYLHRNPKHDPPDKAGYPENRRKYQLDYIASKNDVRIVIIGEAPGLDGCGFGGIAFTGEYNAIYDLGLPDYHQTGSDLQKEQSANLIYGALKTYCQRAGVTVAEAARHIYLTNAIMCVPLNKNGRSIAAPSSATRKQCGDNLVRQLEILKPPVIVTLGANALKAVAEAFALKVEGKLTEIVRRGHGNRLQVKPGCELIPEIHPSPRNRVLGELYTTLPQRLNTIFSAWLE
jgi:uracil-DNA glycosylase